MYLDTRDCDCSPKHAKESAVACNQQSTQTNGRARFPFFYLPPNPIEWDRTSDPVLKQGTCVYSHLELRMSWWGALRGFLFVFPGHQLRTRTTPAHCIRLGLVYVDNFVIEEKPQRGRAHCPLWQIYYGRTFIFQRWLVSRFVNCENRDWKVPNSFSPFSVRTLEPAPRKQRRTRTWCYVYEIFYIHRRLY